MFKSVEAICSECGRIHNGRLKEVILKTICIDCHFGIKPSDSLKNEQKKGQNQKISSESLGVRV
jgi:lysyl-tRNA synthetase class I